MIDTRKEYIVCAAIKRLKSRDCTKHYYTNDIYDIEIGYRHCDIFARFDGEVSLKPQDQGFYTSHGRFLNRYDAMEVAMLAGQVHTTKAYRADGKTLNQLFSEDLY